MLHPVIRNYGDVHNPWCKDVHFAFPLSVLTQSAVEDLVCRTKLTRVAQEEITALGDGFLQCLGVTLVGGHDKVDILERINIVRGGMRELMEEHTFGVLLQP